MWFHRLVAEGDKLKYFCIETAAMERDVADCYVERQPMWLQPKINSLGLAIPGGGSTVRNWGYKVRKIRLCELNGCNISKKVI
jgi:hypothetical protein